MLHGSGNQQRFVKVLWKMGIWSKEALKGKTGAARADEFIVADHLFSCTQKLISETQCQQFFSII